jgi:hypothetical protein
MVKRNNRLRDILEEKQLKQSQAADMCGIKRDRFRKIVGNHVEILGWELTQMADALEIESRLLYEPDQIDVKTLVESDDIDEDYSAGSIGRWRFSLAAADQDTILWLRQGLQQQEYLDEGPGYASISLLEGRILLGRAVEHIGVAPEERDPRKVVANQLISVIRENNDEDKKLSRFQLDITSSGDRPFIAVYVQSHKIRVREQGTWRILSVGDCIYLQHNDLIQLPNRMTLKIESSRI